MAVGLVALASLAALAGSSAMAQEPNAASGGEAKAAAPSAGTDPTGAPKIEIELNKLEPTDKGCQLSFVVNNGGADELASVKLDIVVFQPDGVIGSQLPLDLTGLRASARTVKKFMFKGPGCERYGSVMINGVMDCKTVTGPVEHCLEGITVKSLVPNVALTKY